MKIQEMKPGISHLTKRIEIDRRDNILELRPPPAALFAVPEIAREDDVEVKTSTSCDLDEPVWSVVSFAQTEAGGLTYRQAATLMHELDLNDIAGLCVITDQAAKRINS